jgi:hypothetical protein
MSLKKSMPYLLGCLLIVSIQGTALAQDDDAARRAAEKAQLQEQERQREEQDQQQRIQRAREDFINSQRDNSRKSVDISFRSPLRVERDFMSAVPQFRGAVATYREAVSLNSSLKDSVKAIERYVDLFKNYFKTTRVDAPLVDKATFKTLSQKEVVWEALTIAERMDTQLRLAVMQMQDASVTDTVSIDTVLFMRELHGDLLRLDLLLSRVK